MEWYPWVLLWKWPPPAFLELFIGGRYIFVPSILSAILAAHAFLCLLYFYHILDLILAFTPLKWAKEENLVVVIQEAVFLPRNQGRVLVSKLLLRKVVPSQHPSQNLHQLLPGGANCLNWRRICQIIMVSKFSYTQHRSFCRANTSLRRVNYPLRRANTAGLRRCNTYCRSFLRRFNV